jgi:predicted secreted protein with PEFG-CTERM motif
VKTNYILIFSLFALCALQYSFASAEECKQVCVAKSFYRQGEAVIVSGKVDAVLQNTPLLIQVFHETNRAHIAQVDVAQDGTFTYSFIADGPYFTKDGKYVVKTAYGVAGNTYETSFDFQTKRTGENPQQIYEVRKPDQTGTFDISYAINGGSVKNITVEPSILGLIVTIQADQDGSLTLDLGRQWIDAKTGSDGKSGDDDKYLIFIDGTEVQYKESTTKPESRLITINFQEGNSEIEIIGTYVVPEFGTIVMFVLAIATLSATILVRKSSLLKLN